MVLMMNSLFTISIPYIDYKSRRRDEHDYALNVFKEEENLVIKGYWRSSSNHKLTFSKYFATITYTHS